MSRSRPNVRRFAPAFLTLLLLIGTGCKKTSEPFKVVASTAAPAGWTVAKDEESGLVVNIPPGWRIGMPGNSTIQMADGTRQERTGNVTGIRTDGQVPEDLPRPDMEKYGQGSGVYFDEYNAHLVRREKAQLVRLRREGIMHQAVNGAGSTIAEASTRFYIQQYKEIGSLQTLKEQEKEALVEEGEGEPVALPVGKAWMYRSQGQNRIGDMVCRISYLMCDGETGYALRFVSTNNPTVFDAIHRQVAKSVRKAELSGGQK